jgi:hypothetical protein
MNVTQPVPDGPDDDCNAPPAGIARKLRTWRVEMKPSGEQWTVTAEWLHVVPGGVLAFTVDSTTVAAIPFGQYASASEIDAQGDTPWVERTAAPPRDETRTAASAGTAKKSEPRIRRLPAADAYKPAPNKPRAVFPMLLNALPADGSWVPAKTVRATFKDAYGGFPVNAYENFRMAVEDAQRYGWVEVDGVIWGD